MTDLRILVMGGSRFMGPRVVDALVARGHAVSVFNRGSRPTPGPAGVEQLTGDRNDPDALALLASSHYDVVVDMSAYLRSQTELLLDVLGGVGTWVHISSGAIYRPTLELPWPETTPDGPWPLWGTYGQEKLGCELTLRARRGTDQSTTCLRFPFVMGAANYVPREEFVFNRLLDQATILLPGDGRAVVQFVSTVQVGEAVARVVDRSSPGSHAYNVANGGYTSLEGFVGLCAEISGTEPRLQPTEAPAGPFDAYNAVFPFPNEPYVLDTSRSVDDGIAPPPTTTRAMLEEAFGYLVDHPERREWQRTAAEQAALVPA